MFTTYLFVYAFIPLYGIRYLSASSRFCSHIIAFISPSEGDRGFVAHCPLCRSLLPPRALREQHFSVSSSTSVLRSLFSLGTSPMEPVTRLGAAWAPLGQLHSRHDGPSLLFHPPQSHGPCFLICLLTYSLLGPCALRGWGHLSCLKMLSHPQRWLRVRLRM